MSPGQDRNAALQISANLSLSAINTHLQQWGLSSASAVVREARVIGPPTNCAAGFDGPHGVPCELCDEGKYKEENGTGLCIPCVAGKYVESSGNTNRSACESCEAGKFSPTLGSKNASSCQDCPATTYSGVAATACDMCPDGSSSSVASSSLLDCTCDIGSSGPDGGNCSLCLEGHYKSVAGSESCSECATGNYTNQTGASACQMCGVGKYSSTSASTCRKCNAGTYSDVQGMGLTQLSHDQVTVTLQENNTWTLINMSSGVAQEITLVAGTVAYTTAKQSLVTHRPEVQFEYPISAISSVTEACHVSRWIQLDLGEELLISRVHRWLPWSDAPRVYCNQRVQLSRDDSFAGEESEVFACDKNGSFTGCGAAETSKGKIIDFSPQFARYVRYYIGRNSRNTSIGLISHIIVSGPRCLQCSSGSYSNISGLSACLSCHSGSYANMSGATACQMCSFEKVSPRGSTAITECVCDQGYHQLNASMPCQDVNECLNTSITEGQCRQDYMRCENSPGSYSCQCNRGYEAEIDNANQPQLSPTSCSNILGVSVYSYDECVRAGFFFFPLSCAAHFQS